MTPNDLYLVFRADVVDVAEPHLWSDEEVWRYMNDAYMTFWRKVGGIPDFTSTACSVPIVAGAETSRLNPSILRIMSASRASDFGRIDVINSTDLGRLRSSDYGQAKELRFDSSIGQVRYMVIGMQKNVARWVQVPERDDVCRLVIHRLPLEAITNQSDEFDELEEVHHSRLLLWMKHLAYSKQDAETFDKGRADLNAAEFNAYCTEYIAEKSRYAHKTRVVQYGGI